MSEMGDEFGLGLADELDALWRFALRLTRQQDDASELVQRTCLRALEQRAQFTTRGSLRSWLFKIEHRIWLNELRSRKIRNHRSFTSLEEAPSNAHNVADGASLPASGSGPESNVLLHEVQSAVDALPEAQRTVIVLVCVEGFSYREAADILDIPIGTVMSRLARARISLGNLVTNAEQQTSVVSSPGISGEMK